MQTIVKSIEGKEMPLMTVIAESLKFISKRALSKLEEQIGKGVKKEKIRWVLTVPALWSEEHKLFMRKAAVEAGIIDQSNSPSLLLCLEPEGASIQCREDAEEALRGQMTKGTVIVVLDCGGGTVDITVHKLTSDPEENHLCEEILPSSGGCEWGSKYVDKYFEEFLMVLLIHVKLKNLTEFDMAQNQCADLILATSALKMSDNVTKVNFQINKLGNEGSWNLGRVFNFNKSIILFKNTKISNLDETSKKTASVTCQRGSPG